MASTVCDCKVFSSLQDSKERTWDKKTSGPYHLWGTSPSSSSSLLYPRRIGSINTMLPPSSTPRNPLGFFGIDEEMAASAIIPPVTVVLEGRSICHCINLQNLNGYWNLALALRLFPDDHKEETEDDGIVSGGIDLASAVPGYVVAYEDMEDDLLLVRDLDWKDFVRVARRIRLIPAKSTMRIQT